MEVTLPIDWNKSLGTQLMALSVFIATGVKKINVPNYDRYVQFSTYKNIFGFTDEDFIVSLYTQQPNINVVDAGDLFKLHSPYFIPRNLKPRQIGSKKYIGLACYQDTNDFFTLDEHKSDFPKCKQYSIEENAMIFQYIKSRGYEILTLDSKEITIEEKIKLLSENCECVIGYEGGIGHICHLLQIPLILLPGNIDRYYLNMLLHLDKRTYFLKSLNELFEWNSTALANTIVDLNDSKGNNKFMNGLLRAIRIKDKYDNENLKIVSTISSNFQLFSGNDTIRNAHTASEAAYINQFYKPTLISGIT